MISIVDTTLGAMLRVVRPTSSATPPSNGVESAATIVATAAAGISALFAGLSWWYSRSMDRPAVAVIETSIASNRPHRTQLVSRFSFVYKNVGRVTARLLEARFAHLKVASNQCIIRSTRPALTLMQPETVFNYLYVLDTSISPTLTDEYLSGDGGPKTLGKHVFVLRFDFRGETLFNRRRRTVHYFLGWEGTPRIYQLTESEYEEIKEHLPKEFQRPR